MWKPALQVAGCFLLLCLAACGRGSKSSPPRTEGLPPLAPAGEFPNTDVLPHTAGPIVRGRNYLYCGTFQLAWNEMQQQILKTPIQLEGDPPIADFLNKGEFQKSDLNPESYLAMAGVVQDGIVQEIRRAMAERFPSADMEVPDPRDDTVFYAYAYLEKTLAFREAFDRLGEPLRFRSGQKTTPVASFGVRELALMSDRESLLEKQITILDYQSDEDFILTLNTTSKRDQIVLAKIQPMKTLQATIDAVQTRIEESPIDEWDRNFQKSESLIVPMVSIGVERKYAELIDKDLLNPGWEAYYVTEARQGIRFRLDEHGARLKSDSLAAAGALARERPRHFVFDKPFLIYLKERSSQKPYFALWVETPEVLEPWPK